MGAVSCVRRYGDVLKHAVGESQRSPVLVTVLSPKGKMSLSEPCCSLGSYFFKKKSKNIQLYLLSDRSKSFSGVRKL